MPRCVACDRPNAPFVCTWCEEVYFCDKECQKQAWDEHAGFCLACHLCHKKIPGTPVVKSCSCRGDKGWAHLRCLVQLAVKHNDYINYWSVCSVCNKPFTKHVKKQMANERVRLGGNDLKSRFMTFSIMGGAYLDDEPDKAVLAFRKCVELQKEIWRVHGENTLPVEAYFGGLYINLGNALRKDGQVEEALETFELVKEKLKKAGKGIWKNYDWRQVHVCIAIIYMHQERYSEAQSIFQKIVRNAQYVDNDDEMDDIIMAKSRLAEALIYKEGRTKEAQELVEGAYDTSKEVNGKTHPFTERSKTLMNNIYKMSYSTGRTKGMDGIPDGEVVYIIRYQAGVFSADVHCPIPNDDGSLDISPNDNGSLDISNLPSPPERFNRMAKDFAVDVTRRHYVLKNLKAGAEDFIMRND